MHSVSYSNIIKYLAIHTSKLCLCTMNQQQSHRPEDLELPSACLKELNDVMSSCSCSFPLTRDHNYVLYTAALENIISGSVLYVIALEN